MKSSIFWDVTPRPAAQQYVPENRTLEKYFVLLQHFIIQPWLDMAVFSTGKKPILGKEARVLRVNVFLIFRLFK
jgi:hypothetical protein